jgi:hypothetical protein
MVLFDGVPTADPNRYTLNLDMLPAAGIETIAVERGPLLLEHGTRAAGGVIRITTRPDAPGPPRSRLMFATGSLDTETFRGGFRRGLGGGRHGVSLSLNRVSEGGYRDVGDFSLFQYHFGVRATVGPRLRLRVSGAGASADLTAAGAVGGADPAGRTEEDRHQIRVTASILPDGPVPLEATVFFASGRRDSLDVETGARVARREGGRAEIRLKGRWRPAEGLSLVAAAGGEFLSGEGGGRARTFSFFSGATWSPLRLASIDAAARREIEGGRYSAWSGAVRVERRIAGGLSLFSSWASVRHRPALEDRTEETPLGQEERLEGGIRVERGRFVHHLTRFRRCLREGDPSTTVDGGPSLTRVDLETDGWHASARVEIARGLFLTAAYQRLHAGGQAPSAAGRFVPRHLLAASLEAERALAGDVLGLEARLSGRYMKGREGSAAEGDREYGIADLHLGLRFVDVVFFATVRNLGDTRPEIAEGFPVAGRTTRFGFTWDFLD